MAIDVGVKPPVEKVYLGDGLFASFDGFQFRLAASDGIRDTNEVFLEPSVLRGFLDYVRECGVKL